MHDGFHGWLHAPPEKGRTTDVGHFPRLGSRTKSWTNSNKLYSGELHTRPQVTSFLGFLQWVAKAFPTQLPHRQPLCAWEQKLTRKCKPGQLMRFLAGPLRGVRPAGPALSPWRGQRLPGCSDAGGPCPGRIPGAGASKFGMKTLKDDNVMVLIEVVAFHGQKNPQPP